MQSRKCDAYLVKVDDNYINREEGKGFRYKPGVRATVIPLTPRFRPGPEVYMCRLINLEQLIFRSKRGAVFLFQAFHSLVCERVIQRFCPASTGEYVLLTLFK